MRQARAEAASARGQSAKMEAELVAAQRTEQALVAERDRARADWAPVLRMQLQPPTPCRV